MSTNVCRTLLQEGPVKMVQKVERTQTREANILAKKASSEGKHES